MAKAKTTKTKKKMGRPPSEFSPDVLPMLDAVTGSGTVTQICEVLGISTHLFYKWINEHEKFSEAVMRVRARADDQIEDAFFSRAKGYSTTLIEEKLDKDGLSHALSRDMHVPADPGAALNFLKNRRPDQWRDKKVVEVEGEHVELVQRMAKKMGIDADVE